MASQHLDFGELTSTTKGIDFKIIQVIVLLLWLSYVISTGLCFFFSCYCLAVLFLFESEHHIARLTISSLCIQRMALNLDPPLSAIQVLELQLYKTMPHS